MTETRLLKKLKTDPRFIPYNEKYDFDYILNYLKKTIKPETTTCVENNALNSSFFNPYFIGFKEYFDEVTEKNNLSLNDFLESIITFANRDLYLVSARLKESHSYITEVDYDLIINSTIQSNIPELGQINVQSGLEASHDGLNTLLNMTLNKYVDNKNSNSNCELNHLDNCAKLFGAANIYIVIKSAYDIAIWEDYAILFKREKEELEIKILNKKNQFLNRIGEYRLKRNIFSYKMILLSAFQEKNDFYKLISEEANKKRKAKRLKSVKLIDNEIKYKIADGIEKESVFKELLSFASLSSYYAFIRNEILPNLSNVNLYDVLILYTEVQHLFSKVFEIKKVESETSVKNFNLFKVKIKKKELINYLIFKTKYSKNQVNQTLDLFIQKEGFYNIWERPLIEIGNYLFPVALPLLSPNILRMLDYWLEKGGFDLDSRGLLFEKHIKTVLSSELKKKGYKFKIPTENIFRNENDEFEEIDLVIELKNITLIAEVKCIKYPFDPRDYNNMYSRLSEGAVQINRKADFLNRYKEHFNNKSFLSKPLIKLVVTNYPIFSGYIIDDVSITDFSLIENYFIKGSLGKGSLVGTKKGVEIDDSYRSDIKYYRNEDEFSDNLENFFKNPIPITEKIKDLYIEKTQITLPESNPKIIMDYVKFKQSNEI